MNCILQKRMWLARRVALGDCSGLGRCKCHRFWDRGKRKDTLSHTTGYYDFKVAGAPGGNNSWPAVRRRMTPSWAASCFLLPARRLTFSWAAAATQGRGSEMAPVAVAAAAALLSVAVSAVCRGRRRRRCFFRRPRVPWNRLGRLNRPVRRATAAEVGRRSLRLSGYDIPAVGLPATERILSQRRPRRPGVQCLSGCCSTVAPDGGLRRRRRRRI